MQKVIFSTQPHTVMRWATAITQDTIIHARPMIMFNNIISTVNLLHGVLGNGNIKLACAGLIAGQALRYAEKKTQPVSIYDHNGQGVYRHLNKFNNMTAAAAASVTLQEALLLKDTIGKETRATIAQKSPLAPITQNPDISILGAAALVAVGVAAEYKRQFRYSACKHGLTATVKSLG